MHGRGCAWQGVCMAGGVHGRGALVGGHAWQGVCMAGSVCGRGGVHGRRRAWQEIRPLQRTVRILLECILVLLCFSFSNPFSSGVSEPLR